MPLQNIYIPKFGNGKISVKFSVLGSYTFIVAPMEVKFGMQDLWSAPPCQISPQSVQRVAPAGRKNLKTVLWVTEIPAL